MSSALLTNMEIILAVIALFSVFIGAVSFGYTFFFGKLSRGLSHLDRIDEIEENVQHTREKTDQLTVTVEQQGDILIALAKVHGDSDGFHIDPDVIEEDLGREPGYARYVDEMRAVDERRGSSTD